MLTEGTSTRSTSTRGTSTEDTLAPLVAAVQANCDLADARHATELSLCTYLLQMREMYRWETGLALDRQPERAQVSRWIGKREGDWEQLIEAPTNGYARLAPTGHDPFDEAGVNASLAFRSAPLSRHEPDAATFTPLTYRAGIGRFGRAEFVLAEVERVESRDGLDVVIAGRELARGMNPPLAMLRDAQVLVRADVLRRWLWTHTEIPNRLGDGAQVEQLLPDAIELIIQHEIGERDAGLRLGPDWELMLEQITDRRTELLLRAVRDLLADCLVTIPWLTRLGGVQLLELWWASFEGMRRVLAPDLAAAIGTARRGNAQQLQVAAREGALQWQQVATALLAGWRAQGANGVTRRIASIDALTPLQITRN